MSTFNPATHVMTIADSVDRIRGIDLDRLFETAPRAAWPALVKYIARRRADLVDDITEVLADLAGSNA